MQEQRQATLEFMEALVESQDRMITAVTAFLDLSPDLDPLAREIIQELMDVAAMQNKLLVKKADHEIEMFDALQAINDRLNP